MWIWVLIIFVIFMASFFVFLLYVAKSRNRRLDTWARSVPLTEAQQSAMWELWQAFKAGGVPEVDPLSKLSIPDREYIKTICSANYRPPEFGSGNIPRLAQFQSLLERGYTPEQAAVIVGMTINRVGRKDI